MITYLSELYHGLKQQTPGARKWGLAAVSAAPKSPAATPKAPAATPKAPAATPKSATATPKSPALAPASSSDASASAAASVCAKCGERLTGAVAAIGQLAFHAACFGCAACGAPLGAECALVDGRPLCAYHGRVAAEVRAQS